MTPYQIFLLIVLVVWPVAIVALLFFMNRLEEYVANGADTPLEAGLEPVSEAVPDREVKIVFGDQVVGE